MDRTLILVKPDAFERRLTGEILARFERKGLTIVAMKHMTVERELAERHYAEHAEKPFFGDLVDFITGGPLVALVLEGYEAVTAARQVIGATNPLEAAPGSIRGEFGLEVQTNLVHGSDSAESAAREIGLFFPELICRARGGGLGPHRSDSVFGFAAAKGHPRAAGGGVPGGGARAGGGRGRRPARGRARERAAEGPRGARAHRSWARIRRSCWTVRPSASPPTSTPPSAS